MGFYTGEKGVKKRVSGAMSPVFHVNVVDICLVFI